MKSNDILFHFNNNTENHPQINQQRNLSVKVFKWFLLDLGGCWNQWCTRGGLGVQRLQFHPLLEPGGRGYDQLKQIPFIAFLTNQSSFSGVRLESTKNQIFKE